MSIKQNLQKIWSIAAHNRAILIVYRLLGTSICVWIMTLVFHSLRPYLAVQYITLLYLLPVMLSTVFWGLSAGILASFLSFLAFNYFFIQPYNTLLVRYTEDLITLMVFLIVAVVMSQLIGQARKSAQLARANEWEATRIYRLISALAGLTNVKTIAQILAEQTIDTFNFDHVEVLIKEWTDEPTLSGLAPDTHLPNSAATLILPLLTSRNPEGEIRFWYEQKNLTNEQTRLLQAYCSQGALAVERAHFIKGENKIRVLEESDRIKTALLNSVSHELRSPLAAIKASISSLRTGGATDLDFTERVELLTTIEEETDALNTLVGNLLNMSRIEAGALNPQEKWNSLQEIIMSVAARMRSQLKFHPLNVSLPDDLPLLLTDFVMMEQVFTNLINNSIKYSPEGTTIDITAKETDEFVLLRVKNQSPSVPEEHLEHIFDKFFRITQADKVTGTGLGLSICKGIIEAHGGKIWGENLPDGFCFNFTLPRTLNGVLPDTLKEE